MAPPKHACGLECVPDRPTVTTFIGPVKILLVQPDPNVYCKKYWLTSLLAFCMFLMGAAVIIIIMFTFYMLKTTAINKCHIFCATAAMQILLPVGMLNIHPYHAPAAMMLNNKRVFEHIITQLVAFALMCVSFVMEYINFFIFSIKRVKLIQIMSLHAIIGFLAMAFCFLAIFFGCWFRLFGKTWRMLHSGLAVTSFMLSSSCFLTGLWKPSVLIWFTRAPVTPVFITVICLMYTGIISSYPIYHWIKAFVYNKEMRQAEQLHLTA